MYTTCVEGKKDGLNAVGVTYPYKEGGNPPIGGADVARTRFLLLSFVRSTVHRLRVGLRGLV